MRDVSTSLDMTRWGGTIASERVSHFTKRVKNIDRKTCGLSLTASRNKFMKRFLFLGLSCLTAFVLSVAPRPACADDHADAPLTAADRAADIGSVFFFLDPNDNTYAVAALTIGGFIVPSMNSNLGFFDGGVRFVFAFENSGDAKADFTIEVTHSAQTSRTTAQTATIKINKAPSVQTFTAQTTISRGAFGPPGAPTFGGGTSQQQVSTVTTDPTTGIAYFGGLIDDPFFFDLGAELAYRDSRFANQTNPSILTRGRDSFSGYNAMAIVLRIPVSLLSVPAGSIVGMSVATQRDKDSPPTRKRKHQPAPVVNVDRMGNPFINNIFTSYSIKDAYNAANTTDDAAGVFAADIDQTLQALQTNATFRNIIESLYVTNGDILRLNTSIPNTGTEGGKNPSAAWPNGRRPNDDVIDTILTLVNNGVYQGDAVNDNELPTRDAFPFFAQPHMPFPPGAGSEDLTRN
jgi:hypothetical protein